MPRRQPTMSWQDVRKLLERFSWIDPKTGVRVTGFNPPQGAREVRRKRVFIRYVTLDGHLEAGVVENCKVYLNNGKNGRGAHQRLLLWPDSGQFRRICDILILEIDGIRIISQ